MPVPKKQWRTPSQAQQKDQLGNENRTFFKIQAKLNDGFTKWTGWFEDRDDFDAFLWAIATDTLKYQKELWKLPVANWSPDIGENLSYNFATLNFLTTTGSNQTYNRPSDWYHYNNTIECLGAGGGGGASQGGGSAPNNRSNSTGGGGGGYGKYTNLVLGTTATYRIGSAPTAVAANAAGVASTGNPGGDTWFDGTTFAGANVGGNGGSGGPASVSAAVNGGAGGSYKGTSGFTGGNGGNITYTGTSKTATGGGGAAGLNGNGNNGTVNSAGSVGTNGGSGDAGFGGTGGTGDASSGGNGTEWQVSPAYGSGGGGGGESSSTTSRNGGNYGGAAGGIASNFTNVTGSVGTQGLIVVTYTPYSTLYTNMPMLGL